MAKMLPSPEASGCPQAPSRRWGLRLIGGLRRRADANFFPAAKNFLPHATGLGIINNALQGEPRMRAWRNWQTRTVQVRMGATPWRFKSSRPHHLLTNRRQAIFYFSSEKRPVLTATFSFASKVAFIPSRPCRTAPTEASPLSGFYRAHWLLRGRGIRFGELKSRQGRKRKASRGLARSLLPMTPPGYPGRGERREEGNQDGWPAHRAVLTLDPIKRRELGSADFQGVRTMSVFLTRRSLP